MDTTPSFTNGQMKTAQVAKTVLNGGREKRKAGKSGKRESKDRKKQRKERKKKKGEWGKGKERKNSNKFFKMYFFG